MFEKVLKRKGSAEGAAKNDKVKQHDTAAEPQAAQPMMEGVPASGAALAEEGNVEAAVAETEVGDLRAYAPAMAPEPASAEALIEPGDDMREIIEGYAEADRQAEEEEAATASDAKQNEAPDVTDLGPDAEKEVAGAFREAVKKSDNAKEEASITALDKFYNGKLDLTTNPNKHTSFQRVCKELKKEITPQTLSSWVRAADFRRKRKAVGKDLVNVTFSHDAELVAVEDEEKRMALAEETNRSPISIRDLRKRVREVNAQEAPDKDLKRVMRKLKDQFSLPGGKELEDLVSDPDKLEKDLSKKERKGLRKGIAAKRVHIETCLKRLEDLEEWLETIDPIDDPQS
jgi:hypothetical protein